MRRCARRSPIRSVSGGSVGSRSADDPRIRRTSVKSTTRCGSGTVETLNDTLIATAVEQRLVEANWVPADTTVAKPMRSIRPIRGC